VALTGFISSAVIGVGFTVLAMRRVSRRQAGAARHAAQQ
jgi:hypothetical protein